MSQGAAQAIPGPTPTPLAVVRVDRRCAATGGHQSIVESTSAPRMADPWGWMARVDLHGNLFPRDSLHTPRTCGASVFPAEGH